MAWTVTYSGTGHSFNFTRGGDNFTPTWQRAPRRALVPRSGDSGSTYHLLGYEDYVLTGIARVETLAIFDGIRSFLGREVTLTDGTSTWTCNLDVVELTKIVDGVAGYEGRMTFIGRV